MLKLIEYAVVMQEVPDEISLALVIAGCRHHCPDCHSKYTWQDKGISLLDHLERLIKEHADFISCICFMGGDQDQDELIKAAKIVKGYGLKTCLYTGEETFSDIYDNLLDELDYLKLGRFDKAYGPLNNPNTNQRMYKKQSGQWTDITEEFWPKDYLV